MTPNSDFMKAYAEAESAVMQVHREMMRQVELRLVTRIEEIGGRVPSNEEVTRYGHRVSFPDGRFIYTWRGVQIIEVIPPEWGSGSYSWKING